MLEHSIRASRGDAKQCGPKRTPTATVGATELLPDDADLAAVVAAWGDLPDGVRQSILMLVKASQQSAR
jgi:hypothetical protein